MHEVELSSQRIHTGRGRRGRYNIDTLYGVSKKPAPPAPECGKGKGRSPASAMRKGPTLSVVVPAFGPERNVRESYSSGEPGKSLRRGLCAPVVHPLGEFHHSNDVVGLLYCKLLCKRCSLYLHLLSCDTSVKSGRTRISKACVSPFSSSFSTSIKDGGSCTRCRTG
jgi:hypothetical protein